MLTRAAFLLRTLCIDSTEADEERCRRWLEESRCLATALAPYIGYARAAELTKEAEAKGTTIKQAALDAALLTETELDTIFSTAELTRPGIAGARKLKRKTKEVGSGGSDA